MTLPTNRTTSNTDAEHVADHNTLHTQHNALEGHAAAADPHTGYRLESVLITAADVAADIATQAELDAHGNATIRRMKAADQTVNNSATLVDDDTLKFTAEVGTYRLDLGLEYNSSTVADIKVRVAIGGGGAASGKMTWWSLAVGATGATVAADFGLTSVGSDRIIGGVGGDRPAQARGRVVVTVAGEVKVQFAQNTAEASDTKLLLGSWLEAVKL